MKAVTFENLKRTLGSDAAALDAYKRISQIGGFGDVGSEFGNGYPALDVNGLSEAKQRQIAEITGEEVEPAETVESLSKLSREKLGAMAKTVGLDGNAYTDKTELAKAILEKKEGK